MSANNTRYRVVDFIGGRILESREMMTLQSIASGIDSAGNIVAQDLNAIYREGATFNVQAVITAGTTTVTLTPINNTLPMQVFVHARWELLLSGDAPPITLATGQTNLYLNWAINVITSAQDATLVDATTGEPTANMGELDYSVSATDNSGAALGGSQLAKNTSPIILFSFTPSGSTLTPVPIDNVNTPAVATLTASGLVRLTTGTSGGLAVANDDPRMTNGRSPSVGTVVDASVRVPVTNGSSNSDGSSQYDLTTDPGGISADKIIWQEMKERVSDAMAWLKAQVAALATTITNHIGVALGSAATHPMPTASQVGAAPLSHITLPLGATGSHPPVLNQDSGGFQVNETTATTTPNDPAYAVNLKGTLVAALTHQGDLITTLLNSLVAAPGGSPLNFTGPLSGLFSVAEVLTDHVNQTSGATNPHGLTLGGLGGTALSISTTTTTTNGGTTYGSPGIGGKGATMTWLILRFAPNGTDAIEVAFGAGLARHGGMIPLPNTNFDYTNFLGHPSIALGMGHGTTYNNIQVYVGMGFDGAVIPAGQVAITASNNVGTGIPGEVDSGNQMMANIIAMAWRTGA